MNTISNRNEQIQNSVDDDELINRLFDGINFEGSTLEPHLIEARLDDLALRRRRGKEEFAQKIRNAQEQIDAMNVEADRKLTHP
jgi:LPS O-antigen subunit length determinant protein (WzzB/FepE family)